MPDSLRLAIGTLTALPVLHPRRVDRKVARGAMLWAPVIGLLLGLIAGVIFAVVRALSRSDLLAAALATASLAWLTRGLHLDGLADLADGLGVKDQGSPEATRARRLEVMRAPDIGAFGVVTVVVVLLVQTAALAATGSRGAWVCVIAVVVGRVALVWLCALPFGAARRDGLGTTVIGAVPAWAALLWTLVVAASAMGLARLASGSTTPTVVLAALAAVVAGVVAGVMTGVRARRGLGGLTGDVLGASVELATTAALVVAALALGTV